MKLIKQNDPRLGLFMQKSGCFVRSGQLIAELKVGKALTAKQIMQIFRDSQSLGYLDNSNLVTNSAGIANLALKTLGDTGRFVEVGIFENGSTKWYGWAIGTKWARADALIQKIKQGGPQGTHFRVVDNLGKLIEDPHTPEIAVQGIYYSILYAYEEGKNE